MWFDWRTIPVAICVMCAGMMVIGGAGATLASLARDLYGDTFAWTPERVLLGGLALIALCALAVEWCRRNPDVMT